MARETRPEPGHLLVVDDNKMNRMLLMQGLQREGHSVVMAENGREALEKLHSQSFDLILLDIEMPEMDGFQVLEALAADSDLRDIPVIMVSASEEMDSVVKCIEMGAEDYLIKPPNPVFLRARVNASLEKKRLRTEQRKLFATFAASEVAEELIKKGFSLGGNYVEASAMFTDIRSFTTLAENQDPQETIDLLNNYYSLMFAAIRRYGGNINQIQGDGLMAIFGAPIAYPDHRLRAVQAGQEMLKQLGNFNQQQTARGKTPIKIGVGIASGRMVAGYAGTQDRATYTCIGDAVNLAARLETYTKETGKMLLIDENTRNGLPAEMPCEPLGEVLFKGKTQPVHVFAIS